MINNNITSIGKNADPDTGHVCADNNVGDGMGNEPKLNIDEHHNK